MSTFSVAQIACACGHSFRTTVASSVNVARSPRARAALRSGSLNAVSCPRCKRRFQASTPFVYLDPTRRVALRVFGFPGDDDRATRQLLAEFDEATDDEASWTIASAEIGSDPAKALAAAERTAALHRIGRHVVNAGPLPSPRTLSRPETARARRRWKASRRAFDASIDEIEALARSIGHAADVRTKKAAARRIAELIGHDQWLPRPAFRAIEEALEAAPPRAVAEILEDILVGVKIDTKYPRDARTALRRLLRELAWRDGRGNTSLRRIQAPKAAGQGRAARFDWRTGTLTVGLDAASDPASLRRKIVHEIGHGVHDNNRARIDNWLRTRFGWEMYRADSAGVERWVTGHMGGWPTSWSDADRERWRGWIARAVVGPIADRNKIPRSLVPPPDAATVLEEIKEELEAAAPEQKRRIRTFVPYRLMLREMYGWYDEVATWPSINGKLFSFNYFYGGLMLVRSSILDLIRSDTTNLGTHILSTYAAMSPMECFAEVYVWLNSLVVGAPAFPDVQMRREASSLHSGWRTAIQLNTELPARNPAEIPSWDWATDETRR